MLEFSAGRIGGIDAVRVLSRIGKVAPATTATMLVEKFGVTQILFTGVAGAGDAGIWVGDIVVAESLVRYDMDASPVPARIPRCCRLTSSAPTAKNGAPCVCSYRSRAEPSTRKASSCSSLRLKLKNGGRACPMPRR